MNTSSLQRRSPVTMFYYSCLLVAILAIRADAGADFNASSKTSLAIFTDRIKFPGGFGWGEQKGSSIAGGIGTVTAFSDTGIIPFQLPDGPYGGVWANSTIDGRAQGVSPAPNPDIARAFAVTGGPGRREYIRFVTDTPGSFSVNLKLTIDYHLETSVDTADDTASALIKVLVGVSGDRGVGLNFTEYLNKSVHDDDLPLPADGLPESFNIIVPLKKEITEVYLYTELRGMASSLVQGRAAPEPGALPLMALGLGSVGLVACRRLRTSVR